MKRICRLLNSPCGLVLGAILLIYPFLAMMAPARILIEIGDAFVLPMAVAAGAVYAIQIWRQPESRPIDAIDFVMVGICGAWFINLMDRGLRLYARLFDKSLQDAWIIGMFLAMLTVFASMHIISASVRRAPGSTPIDGRVVVVWALAAGVVFAIAVVLVDLAIGNDGKPSVC